MIKSTFTVKGKCTNSTSKDHKSQVYGKFCWF